MPGVVKDKSGGILLKRFITSINNSTTTSPDDFEPDNSFSNQNIIISDEIQYRNLSTNSDVDWVTFTITSPRSVKIDIFGTEGDTILSLYNEDTSKLINFNDDKSLGNYLSTINESSLPTGSYKIRVESYKHLKKIDNYQLLLELDEAPKNNNLNPSIVLYLLN